MNGVSKAYAWQEAIELSKRLALVCEEFSDASTNVLVWHLREAIVEVPAGIAADLQAGRPATMTAAVKLATALELVRRIYPAIDAGEADERLDRLMQRMQSGAFGEREPEPEPEPQTEQVEPAVVDQPIAQPVAVQPDNADATESLPIQTEGQ
jgi:hypothetical protein